MKEIMHTWFFEQTPETVWEYLTEASLLGQWLMPNDIKPVVGHTFRFTTKPAPQINFDGIVYCVVLEVEPFRRLSYSWKGGPDKGNISLDTVVTWTLQPKENGTELLLVQSGFKEVENADAYRNMNMGWGAHILTRLEELLKNKTHETTKK